MKEAFLKVLSLILVLGKHLVSMFVKKKQENDDNQRLE